MAVIVDENHPDDCANGAQSPHRLLLKLLPQTSEAKLPGKHNQEHQMKKLIPSFKTAGQRLVTGLILNPRLRALLLLAALLAFNTVSAFAQSTTFNSTDLKTGISNSLAVIMMFGFVLGISAVIYGGFAIRRGDVDQGKMSIIGGAIIAAAPAAVFAFYKIFGLDGNSAVGVGNF
jgi:hypothetical protein